MRTHLLQLMLAFGTIGSVGFPVARAHAADEGRAPGKSEAPADRKVAAPDERGGEAEPAERPAPTPAETDASEEGEAGAGSDEARKPGELAVIVFLQGADAVPEGIEVLVEGQPASLTNRDGAARLTLAPGRYALHVVLPPSITGAGSVDVAVEGVIEVQSGIVSQALVTVETTGKVVAVDIEAPSSSSESEPSPAEQTEQEAPKPKGWLDGVILSEEKGTPIEGAQVFVRGHEEEITTDAEGRFRVQLVVGTYVASVIHPKYSTQTSEEFVIEGEATKSLEIRLVPAAVELDDYVVTAPFVQGGVAALQAERRETTAVADVIGAEQMTKTGASDAAAALSRVTGLTVVGGKFVYVRGMGERYSSTLMNGSAIPSPEPERRVVPLDLFPSTILESVVVQKTYSPERPGEFGGGVVEMRTRRFPKELTFAVQGSLGANTITTFQDGLDSRGGSLDWLGTDDGTRALPATIEDRRISEQNRVNPDGFTPEELEDIGRSFPRNYNLFRNTVAPDHGLTIGAGNTSYFGKIPFGYMGAVFYSREFDRTKKLVNTYALGETGLTPTISVNSENLVDTVKTGGIINLGSEYVPGHELNLTTLLLRITDNEALFAFGDDANLDTDVRWTRLRFIERQLFTQQVRGTQRFESFHDFGVDWRYSFSQADRDEPDRRELRYDDVALPGQPADFQFSRRVDGNQRVFSELGDQMHDMRLDLFQPFELVDEIESKVQIGGAVTLRNRDVDTRRFAFEARSTGPGDRAGPGNRGLDPESLFAEENIARDGYRFEETTLPTDAYSADQHIIAGYAMTELTPWTAWNFMAGVRVEQARQQVDTFDRFSGEIEETALLDDTDVLPAATITWKFWEDMQLRGGVSRTVSRPDFRELSVARFFDVESTREVFGNPDLKRATLLNFDVRWEWYFGSDESVSIGGFLKTFDDPVETVGLAGSGTPQSWINAESAINVGAEIEGRKRLGFIGDAWDDFYVASNFSLIHSSVEVGDPTHPIADVVVTNLTRPLQGQSPYVINAQVGYDDVNQDGGINAAILYNVFGARISEVGSQGRPDIYDEPVHRLDIVAGWQIDRHFRWSVKVQNLINPAIRRTQGGEDVESAEAGIDLSTSLSWRY